MVASTGESLGLYISIPFCRSKCTYCNFASGVYPASEHARYVGRLVEDLRYTREWAERLGAHLPRRVTPSTWAAERPACWRRSCSHGSSR